MDEMNAIGKKGKRKKKVVYVKQGGRKKSILPLLLGGGVLAYFLFIKKSSPYVPLATSDTTPKTGTSGTWYASSPEEGDGYTPSGRHYTYVHTAYNWLYTDSDGKQSPVSMTVLPTDKTVPVNWGTQYWDPWSWAGVTQQQTLPGAPPVVVLPGPVYQPTETNYALKALVDKRQQLYNGLAYGNFPSAWIEAFQEMQSQGGPPYVAADAEDAIRVQAAIAELQAASDYVQRYWSTSTPLTSNDQPLYSQVVALRNKYGVFI